MGTILFSIHTVPSLLSTPAQLGKISKFLKEVLETDMHVETSWKISITGFLDDLIKIFLLRLI